MEGVLNRDDFTTLALRQMPELTAFTRRLARSVADADDLLQSTYEEAFRSWKALRDPGACRAWLFRIARNRWIDRYRASLARPELHAVDPEELEWLPPDTAFVESVERVDLERALERLSHEQREAVLLSDLWGFSYDEIGAITDVPIGTVRSRIARGRQRVAAFLTGLAGQRRAKL